jgi:hypothetical protein
MDYLLWNEIPTVLGNLVGGLVFVGLPLYYAHRRRTAPKAEAAPVPVALAAADGPAETPELVGAPR